MATINTFRRKEVKYLLTPEQYGRVRTALAGPMKPDAYGASVITSTYLDTPDAELIRRSLEKPVYKEKLRIRRYGDTLTDHTMTFVEIKKKYKGVVYKRRVGLNWAATKAMLSGMPYEEVLARFPQDTAAEQAQAEGYTSRQIAAEVSAFMNRYDNLRPAMDIRVVRTAWKLTDKGEAETPFELRVTFDEHMRSFDYAHPEEGWQNIASVGAVLMEIKATGAYPLWLTDILAQCGCAPVSFSKYGTAYTNSLKGAIQCSIA